MSLFSMVFRSNPNDFIDNSYAELGSIAKICAVSQLAVIQWKLIVMPIMS